MTAEQAAWFWDHVRVSGPDECWLWTAEVGERLPSGHWRVWLGGRKVLIHRVAFVLAGGELLDGLLIRHRCPGDPRPDCANPHHLCEGTPLENAQDRDRAGRRTPFLPRGERHWSARLTQADAERIREARRLGLRAEQVARVFGVSRATVYAVWSRARYVVL